MLLELHRLELRAAAAACEVLRLLEGVFNFLQHFYLPLSVVQLLLDAVVGSRRCADPAGIILADVVLGLELLVLLLLCDDDLLQLADLPRQQLDILRLSHTGALPIRPEGLVFCAQLFNYSVELCHFL